MEKSKVLIRPLKTWDEFRAVENIQSVVWQSNGSNVVVPSSFLMTVQKEGGVLLGAFVKEEMAGFVFGFAGIQGEKDNIQLKHCSHMLAVLPKYRNLNIGESLKIKQREIVLSQGLDLITWTVDPLQAINANLNFSSLGAIARQYIPDAYGEMTDIINAGLSSDRFEVEWWINSFRTKQYILERPKSPDWNSLIEAGTSPAFDVIYDNQNLPHIENENKLSNDSIFVEIPHNLSKLKNSAPVLAQEWRMRTRNLFQDLFSKGYVVIDFMTIYDNSINRCAHVLTRDPSKLQEIFNAK